MSADHAAPAAQPEAQTPPAAGQSAAGQPVVAHPGLAEAFVVWVRVAVLSFGGPAGQIAVMHRILVDEKRWISEDQFLHALSYCMLLPGPEAQQLATYCGWLLHRLRGGLLAGILFILPGFVSILLLSIVYAVWQETPLIAALFFGMKPAVMAIVCEAVLRIGRRILKNRAMVGLAAAAFILIFCLAVPFPLVLVLAALTGLLGARWAPHWFVLTSRHGAGSGTQMSDEQAAESADLPAPPVLADAPAPTLRRAALVSAVCLTLWFAPLLALQLAGAPDSVFLQQGWFFSKTAVVTFGGAYAVLTYIAQEAVGTFHWLRPGEMLDGLGMAETTPGPLIMVVQFVGFMGAWRNPGGWAPWQAGVLGAVVTTWVTFVPCFYWIFLGAPYVERLRGQRLLNAMLSAITAAVVGVILNLAVWFTIHTLFHETVTWQWGPFRLLLPVLESVDGAATGIALTAMALTFWWRRGMVLTLAVCCGLGLLVRLGSSLAAGH